MSNFLDDNCAWMVECLNDLFWPFDVREILKIRTSPRQKEDFIAWHMEKIGLITICSACKLAMCDHVDQFGVGGLLACTRMGQDDYGALFRNPKFHRK